MLAVFNATDKESGIKATYIRWRNWFFWSDWKLAQNPAPFPKQAWIIQIKAVDNKENTTLQTVYLKENIIIKILYAILLLGAASGIFLWIRYLIRYFVNRKSRNG